MLNVILHQPEIPQNTGNIGRTCVAVGAKLWLVRPLGFRIDDHHLQRAGLDYWKFLDWQVVVDWPQIELSLEDRSFWYFSKSGTIDYTQVQYGSDDALVFGSETQGLPRSMLKGVTERVLRIPTEPQVRSLNLATAVGIAVYEARRQISGS